MSEDYDFDEFVPEEIDVDNDTNKSAHCDSHPLIKKDLNYSIDVNLPSVDPKEEEVELMKEMVIGGHKLVMNKNVDTSSNDNRQVNRSAEHQNIRMQSIPRTRKISKINRSIVASSGKEPNNSFHSKSIK